MDWTLSHTASVMHAIANGEQKPGPLRVDGRWFRAVHPLRLPAVHHRRQDGSQDQRQSARLGGSHSGAHTVATLTLGRRKHNTTSICLFF